MTPGYRPAASPASLAPGRRPAARLVTRPAAMTLGRRNAIGPAVGPTAVTPGQGLALQMMPTAGAVEALPLTGPVTVVPRGTECRRPRRAATGGVPAVAFFGVRAPLTVAAGEPVAAHYSIGPRIGCADVIPVLAGMEV